MVQKIRILIADDHAIVREGLRALIATEPELELVAEASDGVEAVDKARACGPDVILLDMMMPHMAGDRVIETLIRERALPGKHAVVLLTASPATVPRDLHAVLKKHEIPVVSKTVTLDEIVEQVEQASARITFQQQQPW